MNKGNKHVRHSPKFKKEELSSNELRFIIDQIKRGIEEDFQEKLKHMTPEEREKAIEFANALL